MARAPSQGADPSTGNKQRAPTQEPALVKVKTCSSLVSLPLTVLPWLAFCLCRFFFFGLGLLGLLLCPCVFWLALAVGVSFQLPGGRDVGSVFFSFSVDGLRPEYRLFQVSLYVCPSGVSASCSSSCFLSLRRHKGGLWTVFFIFLPPRFVVGWLSSVRPVRAKRSQVRSTSGNPGCGGKGAIWRFKAACHVVTQPCHKGESDAAVAAGWRFHPMTQAHGCKKQRSGVNTQDRRAPPP